MRVFEVVIAMLLGGAALAAVARRIGAPYPALVALAGAALALIPGVASLALDPELDWAELDWANLVRAGEPRER